MWTSNSPGPRNTASMSCWIWPEAEFLQNWGWMCLWKVSQNQVSVTEQSNFLISKRSYFLYNLFHKLTLKVQKIENVFDLLSLCYSGIALIPILKPNMIGEFLSLAYSRWTSIPSLWVIKVSWWQAAFEWGSVQCSRRSFIVHLEYATKGQSPKSIKGRSSIAYVKLCGARDRSCGQQEIVASITTMLQHILPRTWFRLFFGEKPDSCGLLLDSLRLLAVLAWRSDTSLTMKIRRQH